MTLPASTLPQDSSRHHPVLGALLGATLGLPVLALASLAQTLSGLPSPAEAAFEWLTRMLPGAVLTTTIEFMVGTLQRFQLGDTAALAKRTETTMAWLLFLTILAVLGAAYGWLARPRTSRLGGITAGLVLFLLVLVPGLTIGWDVSAFVWAAMLSLAWGLTLAWAEARWQWPVAEVPNRDRRNFLIRFGVGVLAVTAGGFGLGWLLERRPGPAVSQAGGGQATPAPSGFEVVSGTRAELTPIPDFYRVDIKLDAPSLSEADWRLAVSGLVDTPFNLSLSDLKALPSVDFYATLECISNNIAGDLISTAQFTGVPLAEVLKQAGLQPGAVDIKFTCADGYTESLPVESATDPGTVLCYAMGGETLRPEHGFPVRLYTPNRFGMKNPKWLTQIEALGVTYSGFWEKRGWSQAAWVKTTSVIDAASGGPQGSLRAGGIAYAGARGIRSVEVKLDEGEWLPADLKPALSGLTWVLWRAEVPASVGLHRLTVRAVDGAGHMQTEAVRPAHPDGATGYHSVTVSEA